MNNTPKTLVFFSFYFRPDLSAGSFRNSTLLDALETQPGDKLTKVVITTKPNRYQEFRTESKTYEKIGSTEIYRIQIPDHQSGIADQIKAYTIYFYRGLKIATKYKPVLVYASSSRLFTGFLGAIYARLSGGALYLDIRDIFLDTILDIYRNSVLKYFISPIVSIVEVVTMRSAQHINLISYGFKKYFFDKYPDRLFSEFTNGIDSIFLDQKDESELTASMENTIIYAGNIGEGQGLHIFVPGLAEKLPQYKIIIIGDGGAKQKLIDKVQGLTNVQLLPPTSREMVLKYFRNAKYTLIHLNSNVAFKKVLPSKVFELAAINKPILAGVDGYAASFIAENIKECLLFKPGDYEKAAKLIYAHEHVPVDRISFRTQFSRKNINKKMSRSILSYVK